MSGHGFKLVSYTCFESVENYSQVICMFSIIKNGSLPILGVRGCLEPEVTSPLDSSTMVFLLMFNTHYSSCTHHSIVITDFLIVNCGGMSISFTVHLRAYWRPEVTSPVDNATMVSY
jgi:hypothetical protein